MLQMTANSVASPPIDLRSMTSVLKMVRCQELVRQRTLRLISISIVSARAFFQMWWIIGHCLRIGFLLITGSSPWIVCSIMCCVRLVMLAVYSFFSEGSVLIDGILYYLILFFGSVFLLHEINLG